MFTVLFFCSDCLVGICFQKLQTFFVAKTLMACYILCNILSFKTRVAQKVFSTRLIFRTNVFVTPSETVSLMLMTQIL